eukprot:scaffold7923_cov121-Isochrysis_galbana.AAC.2
MSRRPQLPIATAMVFYHRFFAFKSYEEHDRFNIATTALFLACKVEETPRKLKDVVTEAYKAQYKGTPVPETESRELYERKEKVLISERILLQTLGFDLSIEHPYRHAARPLDVEKWGVVSASTSHEHLVDALSPFGVRRP